LFEANVKSSKLGTRSERVGSERREEILEYVCGLTLVSASILNQNPFFEIACNIVPKPKANQITDIVR